MRLLGKRADEEDQAAKKPAIALELPPDIWSRDSWPSEEKQLGQAERILGEDQVPKENREPKGDTFGLFLSEGGRSLVVAVDGTVYAVSDICSSSVCSYPEHGHDSAAFILTTPKSHMKYVTYSDALWAEDGVGPEYKQKYSLHELYKIALINSQERIAYNHKHPEADPRLKSLSP